MGNKHWSPKLSRTFALSVENFECKDAIGSGILFSNGVIFWLATFNIGPIGSLGRGQEPWVFWRTINESCLLRGDGISGSVKMIAVAGILLSTMKPVTSNEVENTDKTTAPSIPTVSAVTSLKTAGFWKKDYNYMKKVRDGNVRKSSQWYKYYQWSYS